MPVRKVGDVVPSEHPLPKDTGAACRFWPGKAWLTTIVVGRGDYGVLTDAHTVKDLR